MQIEINRHLHTMKLKQLCTSFLRSWTLRDRHSFSSRRHPLHPHRLCEYSNIICAETSSFFDFGNIQLLSCQSVFRFSGFLLVLSIRFVFPSFQSHHKQTVSTSIQLREGHSCMCSTLTVRREGWGISPNSECGVPRQPNTDSRVHILGFTIQASIRVRTREPFSVAFSVVHLCASHHRIFSSSPCMKSVPKLFANILFIGCLAVLFSERDSVQCQQVYTLQGQESSTSSSRLYIRCMYSTSGSFYIQILRNEPMFSKT